MKIYKKQFVNIKPQKGNTSLEQLNNCLTQLSELLLSMNLSFNNIIKQTIFIRSYSNEEYTRQKNELITSMSDFYSSSIPTTCYIGQPPENNLYYTIEIILLHTNTNEVIIEHKKLNELDYTVINYKDYKEVHASGLWYPDVNADIEIQSKRAFELMKQILDTENLSFADVIRQWNYIENIISVTNDDNYCTQNYQIFNDVRSVYYATADFIHGYPAATGIGMNTGGIIIDFIAVKTIKEVSVIPIKNPLQIDAHKYSQKMLIGDAIKEIDKKTSPKFERAKYFSVDHIGWIYISGTAAIHGEETNSKDNVAKQTQITIDNIFELVSQENLKNHGIEANLNNIPFAHFRVYIKNESDIKIVKEICERNFKEAPAQYLISDVCRDDLLVEIEGAIEIP